MTSMASSKPLPPIPVSGAEKALQAQTFAQAQPQSQTAEQSKLPQSAHPDTPPVNTLTSIFSSLLSSAAFSSMSASKAVAAAAIPRHPSRAPTPTLSESTGTPTSTALTGVASLPPPGSRTGTDIPAPASSSATPAIATSMAIAKRQQQVMVSLDQRSFQHLRAIARQSIASSYLEPEILWQRLFMDLVHVLAVNAANAWQQIEAAHKVARADQNDGTNGLASIATTAIASGIVKPDMNKEQAEVKDNGENKDKDKDKDAKSKPAFNYSIRLVKNISSTQECSFTAGRFEGEPLLLEEQSITERRRPPKGGRPIIPLGGTISLAAGLEDLPKAEKILELLVFALCSLHLEAYLMRDHNAPRPDISAAHEADAKYSKSPTNSQPTTLSDSKRASKGSMFFGWLSRGTLPAKYKKGTTQLAQDLDTASGSGYLTNGLGQNNRSSIANDFGMAEDLQSYQSHRFAKIIQQVEKAIISVSPEITFPPPYLLLRLRDEEVVGPDSKRKSYTWEDVEFVAKKIGFGNRLNQANIAGGSQLTRFGTTSISVHNNNKLPKSNRLPADSRAGLDHLMTNSNSLQGIFNHQSITFSYSYYWSATAAAPCNPPNLITVDYYRKAGLYEDMGLGEMIEYICKRANSDCLDKTCGHKRLEHISTYTHGEARINITVEQPRIDSATDFDLEEFAPFLANNRTIAVWTRCKMCKAKTKSRELSRPARLYSFGKYLELLLYGQHFTPGPRPLCGHALNKDAIARCFFYRELVVTFEFESIDLFEMRISRLQVHEDYPAMPRFNPGDMDDDRHHYSTSYSSTIGSSPRASTLSVSVNGDYLAEAEQANILDTVRLEIMHFYESCKKIVVAMEEHLGETKSISKQTSNRTSKASAPAVAKDPAQKVALDCLDELGERWKADEFDLYDQLKHVSLPRLNELRNRFRDYVKRTMRSMETWQNEHYPEALQSKDKGSIEWALPDYVICRDYLGMVSTMLNRDSDGSDAEEREPSPPPLPKKDYRMEGFLNPTRTPLKTSRSDGSVTLLGRKCGINESNGSTVVSSSLDNRSGSSRMSGCNVGDDEEEDEEEDAFLVVDGYQTSVKLLQISKVDFASLIPNGTMSPRSTIGIHFGSGRHGKNSTLGLNTADRRTDASEKRPFSMMSLPNSTPALVASPLSTPSEKASANSFFVSPPESRSTTPTSGGKSKHTFGYQSLTSGLSGTMKGLSLNSLSEKIGNGFSSYNSSSVSAEKVEKELLISDTTDGGSKETPSPERDINSSIGNPHIKARFSHGKTSFSCTVYYAAEFDTLRRRCGIHQIYVESLSRCTSWNANGGKSKSSFYKSKDERFVIKQMISSWNIAEKDELLKFAPKYFDYMEKTHEAPTVLAKIFGFYSLKIKNGESGQVVKMDVLVMEHLFYKQKITRTFDLKGIQDRHAGSKSNAGGGGSTTLWDGDFIEGRYRALLLLHSHSKKIIRASLLNDTEFLAAANIMDYSLLVGVDDERKELVVGIVDFIGAYTWYKRIESKGKTTLRGAKDNVTVLPPQQYKTRFREAMERYFLSVPDKWSKTVVEQEEEAKEANSSNGTAPITIHEGSNENLGAPDLEQTLKNKTSGYLEKMSKAILPSKPVDSMAPSRILLASTEQDCDDKRVDGSGETEARVQKLPRVFHPLD
ncbi:hypothetical protein BGZ54_001138 [Gamsiella multidivaricata]|nr:hypothetical protein BGZ54_001138 [Gamsiella multidivaricata]